MTYGSEDGGGDRADHIPGSAAAEARELDLDTRRGRFGGLRWTRADSPRVLALHGWLDNAASFIPMAAHLEAIDLVALDMAGHGHSEHRPAGTHYYFLDYLFDIDAALDALDWPDCHLVGHSMGAALGSLYAAAAPERVRSLSVIDSLGPLTGAPEATAARLRRSMVNRRNAPRPLKPYPSLQAMIDTRVANADDLSVDAAALICARAARRDGAHYVWRTDPELHWVSPVLMSEEQALDCLSHIRAPTLAVIAPTFVRWAGEDKVEARMGAVPDLVYEEVEGGHHFHMDHPARTATRIADFIRGHDVPPQETR